MKRKLLALLLVGAMIGGTLAFAGCDTLASIGGGNSTVLNPGSGSAEGGDSGSGSAEGGGSGSGSTESGSPGSGSTESGSSGSGSAESGSSTAGVAWQKDDDYHWHTESDKALHTVENGVCSLCGKEVTHTVGLEYTLNSNAARSADSAASYTVSGIGSAAETDIVIPETHNGIAVTGIGDSAFANTNIQSIVLPLSIVFVGKSAFDGCLDFTEVYYCGDKDAWSHVSVASNNQGLLGSIIYTYVKGTPQDPGYYWGFDKDYAVVPFINWVGANNTSMSQPFNIYYQWVVATHDYTKQYRDAYITETLTCNILSVNGEDVEFEISSTTNVMQHYISESEDPVTGETTVFEQWEPCDCVSRDDFEKYFGKVELSADWGSPQMCLDPENEEYYGYIIQKDICYMGNNARAILYYYIEVVSAKVENGKIHIKLQVRDVTLHSSEYYYDGDAIVWLTRQELERGGFGYFDRVVLIEPWLMDVYIQA